MYIRNVCECIHFCVYKMNILEIIDLYYNKKKYIFYMILFLSYNLFYIVIFTYTFLEKLLQFSTNI